jgi:hypothetical protein
MATVIMQRLIGQIGRSAPPGPLVPEKERRGAENQPKATSGGFLLAWDPVTQRERWRVTDAGSFGGGFTVTTAGNLVFHGAIAYNAQTGAGRKAIRLAASLSLS